MSAAEDTQLTKDSCVLLNDGNKMPVIGFGTFYPYSIPDHVREIKSITASGVKISYSLDQTIVATVEKATKTALDLGYRHVDGAYAYLSEEGIGRAFQEKISQGTLTREDIFYTTKLWLTFHQPHLVRSALEKSLHSLKLNYVDLFIIHHPISLKPGDEMFPTDDKGAAIFDHVDLCQTWEALERCKDTGLVKSIGVSNFNRRQLKLILNKPGLKYKPVCNQIECHPYLNQREILEFCKLEDIAVVAYGVVGSPGGEHWVDHSCPTLLENPVLISIGEKYRKTPAQVSIRYMIQRGCVAIIKSFSPDRMRQNLQVFDFHLSPADMEAIDGLNKNQRYYKYLMWEGHPQFHYDTVS